MPMVEPPLALTMGDPAGIGPDITLLAWQQRQIIPPFVALADPDVLAARASQLMLDIPFRLLNTPSAAVNAFADSLPIMPIKVDGTVRPGKPDAKAGAAIQASIEQAVRLVHTGEASAVVTNPISKAMLYAAGFSFPGHTEYLATIACEGGEPAFPVMMLASERLKVIPVTIHIPLAEVPQALTSELILKTIVVAAAGLRRYFGVAEPRIALTGLNPHAGESGTIGKEEEEVILPAIEAAREAGLSVAGPYSADTMFHAEARRTYDVAIAMYHDQALIPIKTLAFDTGVNVTLGLPFVRTSPDHGTAFSIAGTGQANPASLIAALTLADDMVRRSQAEAASGIS
jgi:4-hydroxythreonine-4-phosphate dehydrogenase